MGGNEAAFFHLPTTFGIESGCRPYLAGASPLAADYYFFMMTRWAPDADLLVESRPKLARFIALMKENETVKKVNKIRCLD